MKAVITKAYGSPDVLKVQELPTPTLSSSDVLIKLHYTTVAKADIRARSFDVPPIFWLPARLMLGLFRPNYRIPGIEFAGEIAALGADVTKYQVGDRVFGTSMKRFGAYAEYLALPQNDSFTHLPDAVSYQEAAALPLGACTALHYVNKAQLKLGDHVLIYGASGSVGTYALQLAKLRGAQVTAVASAKNHELLLKLGADDVLDYQDPTFEDQLLMYDVLFIAVDAISFDRIAPYLKRGGVYINVTQPLRSYAMLRNNRKFRFLMAEDIKQHHENLTEVATLVSQKKIKPVIDREYALPEISESHRYADAGHKVGNIVIKV